jgi:hypothetical protein
MSDRRSFLRTASILAIGCVVAPTIFAEGISVGAPSDVLMSDMLQKAVELLRKNKVPTFEDGNYHVLVPKEKVKLIRGWQEQYGSGGYVVYDLDGREV